MTTPSDNENQITTALRAGETLGVMLAGKEIAVDTRRGLAAVLVPDGYELHKFQRFQDAPAAKRGHSTFNDAASFAAYVNAHKSEGTAIAYEVAPAKLVAIFDHHTPSRLDSGGPAGWARHSAELKFTPSREMVAWRGIDGKALGQVTLAEFLEDRLDDVASPSGAELLEVVQKFEETRSARFASAIDLHSGACDLVYAVKDAAPTSRATLPREFMLGLPPYMGDERYKITARLRYRVNEGALTITLRLMQIDAVLEAAIVARVEAIAQATGIRPYFGTLSAGDAHHVGI